MGQGHCPEFWGNIRSSVIILEILHAAIPPLTNRIWTNYPTLQFNHLTDERYTPLMPGGHLQRNIYRGGASESFEMIPIQIPKFEEN